MEMYVESLKAITDLVTALNAWDKQHPDGYLWIKKVELFHTDSDEPYGELVDEVGGAWAFRPHSPIDTMVRAIKGEN